MTHTLARSRPRSQRLPAAAALLAAASLLGACATHPGPAALAPGATVSQATSTLGPPTGRYTVNGGERLEYATGPMGRQTYMLDFDAQGKLVQSQQVLAEPRFNGIRGGMSRDDVLATLGHPSDMRPLPVQHQTLWSYRYQSPFCQWFQVSLDASGKVVDTGYAPDPHCEEYENGTP
jgi:hypothetical protein